MPPARCPAEWRLGKVKPRGIVSACLVDMDIGIILFPHGVVVCVDRLFVVPVVEIALA